MDPSEVTVLVVEDDEFTRMATIDILKSCRYTVFAVENGRQALDLLVANHAKFDLVLCDVMLPVMTGIELLDEIQKHSATLGHLPIVMTSSNEEMDVVTSCLSKGAKDYLIKPIQVNTAKTLVRHVWLSRRLERTSNKSMWQDIEVIRTIGKGTHGTVVLARRKLDGAVVAVKRVRISQISENGRKQADNEVILLKSLYHVNIVRFYDHFLADDELNIVMEYADGGNLRQLVKLRSREKMGPFPEPVIMSSCWRWPTSTARTCCTATSRRRTSSSRTRTWSSSATSASPRPSLETTRPTPRAGRPRVCRLKSAAASHTARSRTFGRWAASCTR
jgi:CheY-like chemotaxis protein